MKTILCFGDSLTHGWRGDEPGRWPFADRWPGVLEAELGPGHRVIEEGMGGRTTCLDDPIDPRLNGAAYLPACLGSHAPVDVMVLMLGTNDAKGYFHRTALDVGTGIAILLGQVEQSTGFGSPYPAPKVLVVAPPPLVASPDPWFAEIFADGPQLTAQYPRVMRAAATANGAAFMDAGEVVRTDGEDGVHWSREANHVFGHAVAVRVRELLADAESDAEDDQAEHADDAA